MIIKDLLIEKLDDFGQGVGYFNDRIVFVSNALIGEVIDVEITKEKSKFYEGKAIKYSKTSTDRVEPICPFYDQCGGCNIMHMDYKDQLLFKYEKVKRVIDKNLSDDILINNIVSDEQYNYRNKITLKVDKKLGLYSKNSNNLVKINKCYLVNPLINDLIKYINDNMELTNIEEVIIKVAKEKMIIFKGKNINKTNVLILKDYVDSLYIYDELIFGKEYIKEEINNYKFVISKTTFFQVNKNIMMKMYDKILSLVNDSQSILDLYCGTGSIGIMLSNKAKKVVGIEINKEAIKDANKNKEINKLSNIEFYQGDAGKEYAKIKSKFESIIVDPPRSGLDKDTIKLLNDSKAEQIIYVSCDIMTLVRDLKILGEYQIIEVTPFDMFPNTYHVENVVLLKRRNMI